MNNFGTLGFIIVCVLTPLYLTYWLFTKFNGYRVCKKVTKRIGAYLIWGTILRMMIESYVIGLICCSLNIRDIRLRGVDKWTMSNSALTLFLFPVFTIFPFISAIFMLRNWKRLDNKYFKERFGELYAGFNINSKKMLFMWVSDFVRKAAIVTVVIFAVDHLWLHMMVLFMSSIWCIILTGYTKIRVTKFHNAMDVFNEIKIILMMYHLMLFSGFGPNPDIRFQIGYSCAAWIIIGLAINMT